MRRKALNDEHDTFMAQQLAQRTIAQRTIEQRISTTPRTSTAP
jgi:hypothetical protein